MVIRVEFTPLVHRLATQPGMVFKEMVAVLITHELGWSRYGYRFKRVGKGKASGRCKHFTIMLTPHFVIAERFPTFKELRLSVCDRSTNTIYINESRWLRTVPDRSHLQLPEYRAYLVSHEVGHILGLDHTAPSPCSNAERDRFVEAPTMMQQTLGIGHCMPSPWPKPDEIHRLRY